MDLKKPPVAVLVTLASFLATPLIYTLNSLAAMQDHKWVFAAGCVVLPLFAVISAIIANNSKGKSEPLFYAWSVFMFTAVVDLFIALELDGYVEGFMEFYLREGEPYLRSSYGTMINWWDGTGHFTMYIVLVALLCAGRDYRTFGLYWVGSITNSMIVFMPGNMTGNKGIRWSYLLNVPYVVVPIYCGVKFIREGYKVKHKQEGSKKTWHIVAEWMFGVWFVAATVIGAFRMIACMGCKEEITKLYITEIEPYLTDTFQYGRMQALVYFYYYIPFYVGALCCLIYPGCTWIKDWSILHAGATMQGQLVYIASSLKWRTEPQFIVPETTLARSIFWTVNLSLVIVPHLHAMYCNRVELSTFVSREVIPFVKGLQGEIKTSQQSSRKIPVKRREGPVTRQHKKGM